MTSKICRHDLLVVHDFPRFARCDDFAADQRDHVMAEFGDEPDIVLNKQNADLIIGGVTNGVREQSAVVLVDAGRRLVKQKIFRAASQRAGDLQQSQTAERKGARSLIGIGGQFELEDQALRLIPQFPFAPLARRQRNETAEQRWLIAAVEAHHHRVQHTGIEIEPRGLEGARHTKPDALVERKIGDVLAVEPDHALLRMRDAGQAIE